MANSSTAANRRTNRKRTGKNNNPKGRNQYSGLMSTARDKPVATAALVGGVAAAGAFLWARRAQITDQVSGLADQISDWRDTSDASAGKDTRTQAEIAQEALTLKELGATA